MEHIEHNQLGWDMLGQVQRALQGVARMSDPKMIKAWASEWNNRDITKISEISRDIQRYSEIKYDQIISNSLFKDLKVPSRSSTKVQLVELDVLDRMRARRLSTLSPFLRGLQLCILWI